MEAVCLALGLLLLALVLWDLSEAIVVPRPTPGWLRIGRYAFPGTDWGATMAASTLFTLPVLIFFLIVQQRMVGGLTTGAVKG